jgi:hypothetical protein
LGASERPRPLDRGSQPLSGLPPAFTVGAWRVLADELKVNYPDIETQLGELISKIEVNDREIEFVNTQALPTGVEYLEVPSLVARGIEAWRVNQTDVVRITRELCLPAFKHDPHRLTRGRDRDRSRCAAARWWSEVSRQRARIKKACIKADETGGARLPKPS